MPVALRVEDVAPLLSSAVPSFGPVVAGVYAHGKGPGSGWDAVAFADHLVDLLAGGNTTGFPAAFAAVERLLREGDRLVQRDYRPFFFLQLGRASRQRSVAPERFEAWLGPHARAEWAHAIEAEAHIQRMVEHYVRRAGDQA